jgi:hypothetical protein
MIGFKWTWLGPKQGSIPAFACKTSGISWSTSVRILDFLVKMRKEHLPNTNEKRYLKTSLFLA